MTRQLQTLMISSLILTTTLSLSDAIVALSKEKSNTKAAQTDRLSAKSEQATVYQQQSKVLGSCQLLVSKAGLRLNWHSKNIAIVAKPPLWRMTVLNTAQRKYFIAPQGRFRACAAMTVNLYRTSDTSILKPRSTEKTTLEGRNVNKISMVGEPALKAGDRNWQKMLLHSADYWVEPTTIIPPPVVQNIQEMYVIPLAAGIPLQLITVNNKSKIENELLLLSVKSRTVSAKEFTIPEKYTQVKAQEDLLTDGTSADVLQLLPGN
jgi:hypothetical protein